MALTELDISSKKPTNISPDEEEDNIELELLAPEDDDDDDFDPNLGLEDDDDDDDDDGSFVDVEDDEEDDDNDADEEEDLIDDDAEEDDEPATETRENARIRTLVTERNKAKSEHEQSRKDHHELQKQVVEMQKATVENQKTFLESHMETLQSQMVQAQNDDDNTKYVELHAKLNEAQMNAKALDSWVAPEIADLKPVTPEVTDANFDEAPQVVHDWSDKNIWFRNPQTPEDKKRQKEALLYSEVLISDGYTVESEGFFDMIDERLELLGLAKGPKNKVKSKSKDKTSSKRRKKKISQTVQGASRTPASRKKSNKNKVTLSPEQMEIADLYDMTHAEYAQEVIKIEKSEKAGNRMTTLKI